MHKLQIYVENDCWSCEESLSIAAETQARFENVEVVIIDLLNDERPDPVFAVPTYVLNGRIISLGNPRREALWDQLARTIKLARDASDATGGAE